MLEGLLGAAGAGAILSAGLMKLASFETVKAYVDAAMQGDPSKTVMSGGGAFLEDSLVLSPLSLIVINSP